jgi:hypothetical protein
MTKDFENAILLAFDYKNLLNYELQERVGLEDKETKNLEEREKRVDELLSRYSIIRFECNNINSWEPLTECKEGCFGTGTLRCYTLDQAMTDSQRHRLSFKQFKKLVLEKTGWKEEDCEWCDPHYIHLSKKVREIEEIYWKHNEKILGEHQINLLD